VAIDGKNVGTLRWVDLCRVAALDPQKATVDEVRAQLATLCPEAQLCVPKEGEPYALMRVHTVTLISADAAVCIHQRPIEGATNEVGAMPKLIDELCEAYRRTKAVSPGDHGRRQHISRRFYQARQAGSGLLRTDQVHPWGAAQGGCA
jgi:hypothetical protein